MNQTKINVKIVKRNELINNINADLYHIVIPEVQSRISDSLWHEFLRHLNRNFSRRLNWSLYKNVPVYEYRCNPIDLEYAIASFFKSKGFVNLVFDKFDYGISNNFGDIPITHQQHLAL